MSLNAFMHPRNIYKTPPDFKALVEDYPEIRQHMTTNLVGKTRFKFSDPAALRTLTKTLLQRDFQLEVEIPPDRLVPTLPNRLNYLLWLEDILQQAIQLPQHETPRGLDVGTGACAVYALLGARRGWNMVGTEQDPESLVAARANVEANQMQQQVQVLPADDTLLTGPLETAGDVHFTLCNPPFFDSEDPTEGEQARARRPPPPGAPSGLREEVSCPGGERAFVGRMIAESVTLRDRCRVFSTMLGHKSSVRPLKKAMYEAGATAVISTELCQGYTKRWAIAWTFCTDLKLKEVTAMKEVKKRAPLKFVVPREMEDIEYNVPDVKQHVVSWLEELQMKVEPGNCNKFFASYKILAMEDTWTHSRRRRRAQARTAPASAEITSDLEPSPASAELGSPDTSVDSLATSDAAAAPAEAPSPIVDSAPKRARCDAGEAAEADPAAKRARCDAEAGDTAEADPAARQACLEARLDAVSLQGSGQSSAGDDTAKRRPALVFTLFVQRKGRDILLQLSLLAGESGLEGLNGVLLNLRNQMEGRVQQGSWRSGGRPLGAPAAAASAPPGPALGSGNPNLVRGMGRVLSHVRDRMRSKISLEPTTGRSPSAGEATASGHGSGEPPGSADSAVEPTEQAPPME